MRKSLWFALALCILLPGMAAAATCTPTGFVRDGINMTAALINPPTVVSGALEAAGCNIGVYYDNGFGRIENAEIFGANYFGVVVNGDVNSVSVDIFNSSIHNIGENPLNGSQHGVAIYYRALDVGSATGRISGNTISSYQKGGIVANGAGADVQVFDNTVTGQGAVDYIAQNGIQVGYGANASVMRNTVSGNSYSGFNYASSGGILVVGGDCYGGALTVGTRIVQNTLDGNDVGIYLSNLNAQCVAPTTPTNIKANNNKIIYDELANRSGGAYPTFLGYQAGISDVGNNDKIINNTISGIGYNTVNTTIYAVPVDADPSFTNRAKVHAIK